MRKVQVVLAQDDVGDAGLSARLQAAHTQLEVVATVTRLTELQQVVHRLQPDVVVLKITDKNSCCQEISQMLNANERVRVVVSSPTAEVTDWAPNSDRAKVIGPSAESDLVRTVTTMATHGLSERESLVLRLIARGYTNKEIATQLDVSVKTIEKYKTRSLDKLGIRSRVEVVKYAISQGWMLD